MLRGDAPGRVRRTYDVRGALDTLVDLNGRKTVLGFNNDRLPTGLTLPTSPAVTVTHSFPSTHSPAQITYSNASLDDLLGFKYEYDNMGRVTERLNNRMNLGHEFHYDELGRLRLERRFGYALGAEPSCPEGADHGFRCDTAVKTYLDTTYYSYDKVGNRTDRNAITETGNRLRRLDGDSLLYDLDGNLVRRFRIPDSTVFNQRLTWNALNQLESVQTIRNGVTTTAEFGYDGLGRRVRKTAGSTTTRYLWDGDNLYAEVDASSPATPVAEYTHYPAIDAPHSVRRGGKIYYYATQLPGGTVSGLIDTSGASVAHHDYTSFGVTSGGGSNLSPLRFAGREYDVESGLYYNRARYYDPELGRFISEDPSKQRNGANLYSYTDNDPVNRVDPSGLDYIVQSCETFMAEVAGNLVPITFCDSHWVAAPVVIASPLNVGFGGPAGELIRAPFLSSADAALRGGRTSSSTVPGQWYAVVVSDNLLNCPRHPDPIALVGRGQGVFSAQLHHVQTLLYDLQYQDEEFQRVPILALYRGNVRYRRIFGGTGTFPVSGVISCPLGAAGLVGVHPEGSGRRWQ